MSDQLHCDEIRILIDAYHDGEATPAERQAVEQHLPTCDGCNKALAQISALSNALTSLSPIKPRRDFADSIEQMLNAKSVSVNAQDAAAAASTASVNAQDAAAAASTASVNAQDAAAAASTASVNAQDAAAAASTASVNAQDAAAAASTASVNAQGAADIDDTLRINDVDFAKAANVNAQDPAAPVGDPACKEMQLLLDAYHDNELGKLERRSVDAHLASCHNCCGAMADIGRVVATLRCLTPLTPKRDFAEEFEMVLARHKKVTMMRRTAWSTASIAAGFAFLVMALHQMPGGSSGAPTVAVQPQQQFSQPNQKVNDVSAPEVAVVPSRSDIKDNASATEAPRAVTKQNVSPAEIADLPPQSSTKDNALQTSSSKPQTAKNKDVASERVHKAELQEIAQANQKPSTVAKQQIDQHSDAQIAEAPAVTLQQKGNSDEVVALYDGGQNPAEELGIPTDEDGLYAIKL